MNLEDLAESVIEGRPFIPPISNPNENTIFNALKDLAISDSEIQGVLDELLLNSLEHGQGIALSIHLGRYLGWFFAVVRDQGPGIHMTLPINPRLSDTRGKSAAALTRLATEEGITGTGVKGRGIGLHLLSELVTSRRGESLILTDGGLFVQVTDLYLERRAKKNIQGTLIAFKVEVP